MGPRYRHVYLLISLLLLLLLNPFVKGRVIGFSLLDILFIATLITSVRASAAKRGERWIALGLGLAWQLAYRWDLTYPARVTAYVDPALGFAFFAYVTALTLREVLQGRTVSLDTIYGALSVYLLIGVAWIFAYALLETFEPGSFSIDGDTASGSGGFQRFVGFSYVTLTTLGYGNIVPTTPKADALAVVEAIVGQIFLAVLVARLVGIQVSQSRGGPSG